MEAEAEPLTTRQKLSRELKEYLGLSVYLYVCFGAIQLYKTALLADHGISYEPYGFAAAKALILGKFILLGRAASIGERHGHKQAEFPGVSNSTSGLRCGSDLDGSG